MDSPGVAALLFHHVGPSRAGTHPSLTLRPERFARFIRVLHRLGYRGVAAGAWTAWRRGDAGLPARPILVTFDDGYADLVDYALPILRRFGWSATIFLAASSVGGRSVWDEPEAAAHRVLSAVEIRTWAARGVEFGAHGETHSDLAQVEPQRLHQEVVGSRDALAELLDSPVTAFAYPYGSYNEQVRELVARSFELAFGLEEGLNFRETDRTRLRRTMVQGGDTVVDLMLRARLGWSPLERARARIRLRERARRLSDVRIRRAAGRRPGPSSPPFRPR